MNIVVIGAQWGDEGKGKIVDFLAEEASVVVRFSGGANAGHTIVKGGERFALHLIPSGVLYDGKTVVLGSAMVIDPRSLFEEIAMLEKRGVSTAGRILISDRAHLVLPSYIEEDKARDAARKKPLGTTGRGIGITYSKKSERLSLRLADLLWDDALDNINESDRRFIETYRDRLLALSCDIASFIYKHKDENLLFEGAQGALLDIDLGTYPYVSSGLSCAAGAAIGGSVGPRHLDKILGVFKAYSTRVGNGPFPTEFKDEDDALCAFIREAGREYGVTTGRPRRCGYLDLAALRYVCRANSIDSLVITHLDIYDTLPEIKACVAYEIDGKTTEDFPASIPALNGARPVLKTFAGWKRNIGGIGKFEDLPREARDYIKFIEDFCGAKIGIISVGDERARTIIREPVWG